MRPSSKADPTLQSRVLQALELHSTNPQNFGSQIWKRLELVSVSVRDSEISAADQEDVDVDDGRWKDLDVETEREIKSTEKSKVKRRDARVVVEATVQEDWLNPVGVLHGAATAYIVDVCSSLPLMALSTSSFWAGLGGLSASMEIKYHAACPLGTRIRIDSSTMNVGKSVANMRCEIRDAETSRLYASGTHTKVDAFSRAGAQEKAKL